VPVDLIRGWVGAICLLILGLALRAIGQDPAGFFWPAGGVLTVSVLAGGMALWQRSDAWTFLAGLGINLAVSLLFWDFHAAQPIAEWSIPLVQINLVTSSLTALLWLAVRRFDRTGKAAAVPGLLLVVQLGLCLAGNVCLLLGALQPLLAAPAGWLPGMQHPVGTAWTLAASSVLGWLAWTLTGIAALVCARLWRLPFSLHGAVLGGLVVLGQTACTVESLAPGWGYRVLLLGGASFTLVLSLVSAGIIPAPRPGFRAVAERWIAAIALGVVLLAVKAAVWHEDRLWAATAVGMASLATTVTALGQRREAWAFIAGLGVNLTVSLVVWHGFRAAAPEAWWLTLVQANVIASAAVALLWLAAGRRLYADRPTTTGFAPLLSLQIVLGVAGIAVVLVGPAVLLIQQPDPVHEHVLRAGTVWGWLALFLVMAATLWHAGQMLARARTHLLCALGLALGVLAACSAGHLDRDYPWLAYHTLMVGWALTGAATVIAGALGTRRPRFIDIPPSELLERMTLFTASIRGWVAVLGILLVGLGLRGWAEDRFGPWWSAGAVLAASGLAASVALWQRRQNWAFVAALGLNLAVSLVLWHGHRTQPLVRWWVVLGQANAIAAAVAALLWRASPLGLVRAAPPGAGFVSLLTVQVALGLVANVVLLATAAYLLVEQPGTLHPNILATGQVWGWLAFVLALLAAGGYATRVSAYWRTHFAGAKSLALGVLAACSVASWDDQRWLAYHTLLAAWALTGLLMVAAGWLDERRASRSDQAPTPFFSIEHLRGWVAVIGLIVVGLALRGLEEGRTGLLWSAGAVAVVSITAALTALWQRHAPWAFVAGLALNLSVSLVLWQAHGTEDLSRWWVALVQGNVLTAAVVALLWLAARKRLVGDTADGLRSVPLLSLQVLLGLVGNAALLVGPAVWLILEPGNLAPAVIQAGSVWGWLSLLAALAAAVWHVGQTLARAGLHVLCLLGLGVGILAACTAAPWDDHHRWLAYHTLMAAWALTGTATLLAGFLTNWVQRAKAELQGWVAVIGLLVLALAVRGVQQDPTGPLWSTAAVLVVSGLAGALALWSRLQVYVYVSGLLLNLAGTIWFDVWHAPLDLALINLASLALASAFWSLVELRLWTRTPLLDLRHGWLPFSHVAAVFAVCGLAGLIGASVATDFGFRISGFEFQVANGVTWIALGAAALALAACLNDPQARFPVAGLYILGLSTLGLTLHSLSPVPQWLLGTLLSSYVLLAAVLWGVARQPGELGQMLRRLARTQDRPGSWFGPAQTLLACVTVVLSVWTCLTFPEFAQRQMGTLAAGLLLVAGLLGCRTSERRTLLQYGVLTLSVLLAVEAGWAWLDPGSRSLWLHRSGLLVVILAPLTILHGIALARSLPPESGWAGCCRNSGTVLGVLTVAALAAVLVQEVLLFWPGLTALAELPAAAFVLAVAGAVGLMIGTALALAVVTGLGPFGLSERGRTSYVYAAEVLLVVLFAHLRLTMPALFSEQMQRYWPFTVIGLAFLGAATGELFRRLDLRVLAEPLERTGVFLPMVPVVIFWVQPLENYAAVWFLIGLLYVVLSVTRRSLGFALLAACAANVGFWLVLHRNQLAFVEHPQLWLIPFALTVLAAEHLNRNRLTRKQRNAIRYLALTVIYVSSTAETFLAGLGQDPIRPVVLVVLAVLGVFAGMLLRVRSFLFLGALFLLLGIFALIRHAAHAAEDRGRIVWLIAGIVLGAAIFLLFAFFEKKRNEVMRLLQKLKDWE
jgi:hypothetical protein